MDPPVSYGRSPTGLGMLCAYAQGCRMADLVYVLANGSRYSVPGRIARSLQNSPTLDPFGIPWRVYDFQRSRLPAGYPVEMVGASSGWTRGSVRDTCVDVYSEGGLASATRWYQCEHTATHPSRGGDSGGPIFQVDPFYFGNSQDVHLDGMHKGRIDSQNVSVFSSRLNVRDEGRNMIDRGTPGGRLIVWDTDVGSQHRPLP